MNQNVKLDNKKESAAVLVHALSHDGRGIACINNKTTFISGALPNETIHYQITQKRNRFNEAVALDILQASPKRATPPCAHFGVCGGCSLQHMDMETQLALKQQTLLDQLNHFGRITPATILPPLQANNLGYRRKARLGVKYVIKKNKLLIGFREKSHRYLADLDRCVVLDKRIGEHLHELSALITSLAAYQAIPQIEVAIGDEEVALIFRHLVALSPDDKEKLLAFAKAHSIHLYLQPNPPLPLETLWPTASSARLRYTLPDEALEFLFHPLDFTQINLEMNRLMVKQALQHLDLKSTDEVLDLFCGIGNFTLPIAKHAQQVTGIEGSIEMTERALANAHHNHISHAHFYAANLAAPDAHAPWIKQYDKVLLDPPRVGAKEILPLFPLFAAKKIVYISCNPATLARDAGELVHQYGYHLAAAGIMNMFPHTSHIEAMAVFEKRC